MALIVENGTGKPDADSYVSVADASAYHSAMGNLAWADLDVLVMEAALRRATQYLDTRHQFAGDPLTSTQALAWPRDVAPWPVKRVQDACCELALRASTGALYADQGDAPVTEETVGPITVKYGAGQNGGQTRFAVVDDLLRGLLRVSGRMTLRLERAS